MLFQDKNSIIMNGGSCGGSDVNILFEFIRQEKHFVADAKFSPKSSLRSFEWVSFLEIIPRDNLCVFFSLACICIGLARSLAL
jgi:hypothetical protein